MTEFRKFIKIRRIAQEEQNQHREHRASLIDAILLSHKIEKHTFSFMLLNKNVSFLDNNLARRNDLRLIKFYNNC